MRQAIWNACCVAPGSARPCCVISNAVPCAGVVIGTDKACDVVLTDAFVSRRHCSVAPTAAGFTITDLGSSNGTVIDGVAVGKVVAPPGVALRIGKTIADSPLVKTAIAGADPNWGRIVSAAGYAGVTFDPSKVTLHLNGLLLYERGAPVDFDAAAAAKSIAADRDTSIVLLLEEGTAAARFWTTDLTAEYVRLNADYHT